MATKKTSKKTAKKAPAKKAATKKTTAKKAPAKKTAAKTPSTGGAKGSLPKASPKGAKQDAKRKQPAKKPAARKVAPAKDAPFHLYDEGSEKFVPAEKAKAVKIPGFDDFRFFLHKSADGKGWTISEATSGGRISVGRTQKEAKEKAAEALGKHGKEDLLESIKRSIARNGTAPGFEDAAKATAKKTFSVTTDDGTEVEVTFDAEFRNHLEFRGAISPTGYRSHFGYDGSGKVEDAARKIAGELRAEYLKEQAKQARKGKKQPKDAPEITQKLKSGVLAALVDDDNRPRAQVHFDDIAEATGATAGEVAATLMVLELDRKVKSLPGKYWRLPKKKAQGSPATGRGRKPNGAQCLGSQKRAGTREDADADNPAHRRGNARRGSRLSQLDAAVKILTDAKEPLTCKEIVRRMFEQKLWNTSGRTPGATLSASMQREIAKRGSEARFRRAERGLYEVNA
jgi:hypothetical protein